MIFLLRYRQLMNYISKRSVLEAIASLVILLIASIFIMGRFEGWSPLDVCWWFVVTVTTVGYGDISGSMWFTKIWNMIVILGGLGCAAVVVSDGIKAAQEKMRDKMKGLGDYNEMEGHVVIMVGDVGNSLESLISEINGDETRADKGIIVCSNDIEESEDKRFKFVRGELSSDDVMTRAGINTAARILIYCDDDNQTILAALACTSVDDDDPAHITAFVRQHQNAIHLKRINKDISIVEPLATRMMVQEMQDVGVSEVYEDLITNLGTHSIYRVNIGKFQENAKDVIWQGKQSIEEKSRQQITVVAAEDEYGDKIFQPSHNMIAQFLYVISDKRPEIV